MEKTPRHVRHVLGASCVPGHVAGDGHMGMLGIGDEKARWVFPPVSAAVGGQLCMGRWQGNQSVLPPWRVPHGGCMPGCKAVMHLLVPAACAHTYRLSC